MTDATSSSRTDPLSDLIAIAAGPIAAVIRSFDQLRRGSEELMRGVENFNTTMATLNETAARVNRLLNDLEEPIHTMIPQITRTVRMANEFSERLAGPIEQVAPGLARLAKTLNAPIITTFPTDLGYFVDAINELVRRMAPLGQIAESAGGLFGLRIPGMTRPTVAPAGAPAVQPVRAPTAVRVVRTPAKKRAPAKKAPAKKKTPAKKQAAGAQAFGALMRGQWRTNGVSHDAARQRGAAHVDADGGAGAALGWHEAEGDPMAEHRREVAARDLADHLALDCDGAFGARRATTLGGDPHEVTVHAALALAEQRGTAAERLLPPRHHPAEPGL